MRLYYKFIYFFLLLLILTACSSNNYYENAIKNGDVIDLHGRFSNLDKFSKFFRNIDQGNKDAIRMIAFSVEGDPIFYDFNYSKGKIKYTYDNSKDKHGGESRGKKSTVCNKVTEKRTNDGTSYELNGCSDGHLSPIFQIFIPK